MSCTVAIHGDSGERFEASDEHTGREVRDLNGQRLGTVEKVFVNELGEFECVRVRTGEDVALIPASAVVVGSEPRSRSFPA